MLLDEPLASLDAPRKLEILALLETLRREFAVPMLYVTHSLGEVLRLADHMVVLERGRAVASGAIGDLFGRTDTPLLSERADAGALLDLQVIANDRAGSVTARIGAQTMVVAADVRVGTNLRAYVLANEVILASARPTGISVRNVLQSVVTRLAHRNDGSVMVELALGETDSPHRLLANVTLAAARELGLAPGQAVHALIKTVSVDAPAGARAIGTG
jgi:molybdate transport system ATP-binding protein